MRRAIAGSLGVLLVSALGVSCGPPPEPLTGTINFSYGCRPVPEEMRPGCPGDNRFYTGTSGSGDPPLTVTCTVQRALGSMPARVQFSIGRGGTSFDTSVGISVCGDVAGENQEMNNGRVDLFFSGPTSRNNAVPGTCHVFIKTLGTNSFSGRLQCTDAPDTDSPARLRFVNGTGTTEMPLWADFEFTSCLQRSVACR